MNHSYKYFENRECQYYPCHKEMQNMNCLFCYCPLYSHKECPGEYRYIELDGKKIKECLDCTFPHEAANYDSVIQQLLKK